MQACLRLRRTASLDIIHAHVDPFYNECRAYGKLEEVGLNGIVAVRCHGYTTLLPTMESELEERFNVTDWDRDLDEYDKPVKNRAIFRAIVKDMVRGDRPLTHMILKKMLKTCIRFVGKAFILQTSRNGIIYRGSWSISAMLLQNRIIYLTFIQHIK